MEVTPKIEDREERGRNPGLGCADAVAPRRITPVVVAGWLLCFALQSAIGQSCQPFKVLIFSKTAGFRHDVQINAGAALIQSLGSANGFLVDHTEDSSLITTANLGQYAAVVFLHTTGDILTPAQQAAFESYIIGGGGFVGIHSATDTEYGWPFYGALVGAYFANHPAIQSATVAVADPNHPSTAMLPAAFLHTDEWYNFQNNVASNPLVNVLLTIDEGTYAGGAMGNPHPIAWCQALSGVGRSWYTGLGHTVATYSAAFFHAHLLGGILWAADSIRTTNVCGMQSYGFASGSPPLLLGGSLPSPTTASLSLSGGDAGATGILAASACAAAMPSGSLMIVIELGTPGLLTFVPIAFDPAGQWQLTFGPIQLPGSAGASIVLQGAQIGPAIGLSNGLELFFCP
jgi:type 1 glutamine amidotransferase